MCLGIPGQIVAIVDEQNCVATVDISGVERPVNIACVVDDTHSLANYIGSWVLVHVGFAMSIIDEIEAQKTLSLLAELGELEQEMKVMQQN
ncbi:HypC/HybG/HupF family hydrogenase formation chaperone [Vibrio hepatarius]|uniref:HypC/HybG/HupF family hydrogenase formation chaperone n=1 Tax=Vibrio hepatarius TaxID=171383 RepID=UPI00142D6BC1|nr:HypC/HybG/HupF family hydrogenase formation chaperone [Vibrio hepatarius]NIY84747.1 HypC/HybG/HupF family hydrogenase formation chaperone [Vibrio hepatarius]NVJ57822.1 HypC/HybG/HupF family hydrogenase formation chaperone [Vibrionaceae bacterium]